MTILTSGDQRREIRGYVGPEDPFWARCMDMPPRKRLAMVLDLAKTALEIEARLNKFADGGHPLGEGLRAMTPTEAVLHLLLWTKERGALNSTDAALQSTPVPSTPIASLKVPYRLSDKSGGLAAVVFDADEMEAMSMLPDQPI